MYTQLQTVTEEHVVEFHEGREHVKAAAGAYAGEKGERDRADENAWPPRRDATVNYNIEHTHAGV